jgi:hypothetical protein
MAPGKVNGASLNFTPAGYHARGHPAGGLLTISFNSVFFYLITARE